jgi:hypothetical protein
VRKKLTEKMSHTEIAKSTKGERVSEFPLIFPLGLWGRIPFAIPAFF